MISLRMLSVVLAVLALAVAAVSIYLSSNLLKSNVLSFLGTQELPPELSVQLTNLVIGQGIITGVTFLIIAAFIIFIFERMVVRPLNKLSRTISQFGSGIEADDIPQHVSAPYEIEHIFTAFRDMAHHVEVAQERGQEISQMKSDFISTAAHQLRTPLTGIRWSLEAIVKEEALPEDKRALAEDALEKNKHLVQIVRTLLDVSAIESGKYKYDFKAISMPILIEEVINELEEHAERQEVSVTFELPEYAPDVRADRERMRWVLINLIENAIRYTPKGGAVTVSLNPTKDRLFVFVSDTGIGIPPEERSNIFERFYRGKSAAQMQNEGNGLGLYIARNVVLDHEGDLNFRPNEMGTGTTFYFSLPYAQT